MMRGRHDSDDDEIDQSLLCKFNRTGNCTNLKCKFRHVKCRKRRCSDKDCPYGHTKKRKPLCSFNRNGRCNKGDGCSFDHKTCLKGDGCKDSKCLFGHSKNWAYFSFLGAPSSPGSAAQKNCVGCQDDFQLSEGVSCPDGDFLCSECWCTHARSAMDPDTPGNFINDSGKLLCPSCPKAFTIQSIANTPFAEVHELFESLLKYKHEVKILPQALQAKEAEMIARLTIGDSNTPNDLLIKQLTQKIIDELLNLHCPNCSVVFVDFDGCFALTCHNCRAGFCAWCLKHCGTNAHQHVRECPSSKRKGDYFGSQEEFNEIHRERKAKDIQNLLADKPLEVKAAVISNVAVHLKDNGVEVAI